MLFITCLNTFACMWACARAIARLSWKGLYYIFQLEIIIHLFIPTNFKNIQKKTYTIIEEKNVLVNKCFFITYFWNSNTFTWLLLLQLNFLLNFTSSTFKFLLLSTLDKMMNEMSAWKWDGRNLWSMLMQRQWYLWSSLAI